MKTIDHFQLNRPVHLARRDVYFKRATELIRAQQKAVAPDASVADYEEILYVLRVARQHAYFSIRNQGENENDEQFSRFINLLAGNVKAILSMLKLKHMVEGSQTSIFNFLGDNQASVALQAEEYQRRANDIIRSIHNTIKLAEEPFEQLKQANIEAADADELARYEKAKDHFALLVHEVPKMRRIAPHSRKPIF